MIYIFGMHFTFPTEKECGSWIKLEMEQFAEKIAEGFFLLFFPPIWVFAVKLNQAKTLISNVTAAPFPPETFILDWLSKWHLFDSFADRVVSPWSCLGVWQTCIAVVSCDYVIQSFSCFKPLGRWSYSISALSKNTDNSLESWINKYKICWEKCTVFKGTFALDLSQRTFYCIHIKPVPSFFTWLRTSHPLTFQKSDGSLQESTPAAQNTVHKPSSER